MTTRTTTGTKMTVHEDSDGILFLYRDVNSAVYMLATWRNGDVSFRWGLHPAAVAHYTTEYNGTVDPRLLKLANSFLEYIDAAVEKEWHCEKGN